MKLDAANVGLEFKAADYEFLQQKSSAAIGENGIPIPLREVFEDVATVDRFLSALKNLFPDSSYSRANALAVAPQQIEPGYGDALQHIFDLIDQKNRNYDSVFDAERFARLFAFAYKFSAFEEGAENGQPGALFVIRMAENITNGHGSYFGYVARLINYICIQILAHQEELNSLVAPNSNVIKARPVIS